MKPEERMSSTVVNTHPFACRWIERGSEVRVSNWTYALCQRMPNNPRFVTEWECAICKRWEPPVAADAEREH
jgi:hypothetical protein